MTEKLNEYNDFSKLPNKPFSEYTEADIAPGLDRPDLRAALIRSITPENTPTLLDWLNNAPNREVLSRDVADLLADAKKGILR